MSDFDLINDSRCTVLVGAGAALDLTNTAKNIPTTAYITEKIVNEKPNNSSLILDLYTRICKQWNLPPQESYGIVHFEILFHVLEELKTYNISWKDSVIKDYKTPFASIVTKTITYDEKDIPICLSHIINKIYEIIGTYENNLDDVSNTWYKDFWKKKEKQWDVFTLNYDTTIEQSVGIYEDGYTHRINAQTYPHEFVMLKLLENKGKLTTINHLHGSVCFGRNVNHDYFNYDGQDLIKLENYFQGYSNWKIITAGDKTSQDKRFIIQGPILTGLSKLEKITCLPYSAYYYNFRKCVIGNNKFLIVGYSFGDDYINSELFRLTHIHQYNKRIVLIDSWESSLADYCKDHEGKSDLEDITKYVSKTVFNNYICKGWEKYCNKNMIDFLCSASHVNQSSLWDSFDKISLTEPMISKTGQLLIFLGGFKNAATKYSKEIFNFLFNVY